MASSSPLYPLPAYGPSRRLLLAAIAVLAVELGLFAGDVHLFWKPVRVAPSTPVAARVVSVFRRAKVRSPFQLDWASIGPGQALHEGDEVATMEGSTLVLRFEDGREATLEPHSLLVLGSAEAYALQGRSIQVSLAPAAAPDPLAATVARPLPAAPEVFGIRIEANELSVPEPRLPSPAAILENPRTVLLTWQPDPSVTAASAATELEVSRKADLSEPLLRRRLAPGETSFEFLPLVSGRFYWRLTRVDAGTPGAAEARAGRERAGAIRDFEVRRALAAPVLDRPRIERVKLRETPAGLEAPRLNRPVVGYPSHGALAVPGAPFWRIALGWAWDRLVPSARADEEYVVDLAWERVTGATAYKLQIATDDRFEHVSFEKTQVERAVQWRTANAGFFYWRVAGVAPGGEQGPWSEFKTFSIRAERNREGDESTYDAYIRFDPYARSLHSLKLSWRPTWQSYYFGSDNASSPPSANFHKQTWVGGQLDYDYKIDVHYSAQFSLGVDKTELDSDHFEDRPNQVTSFQTEKTFAVALERRYFWPRSWLALRGGLSFAYIDIPVQGQNNQLVFNAFGYFGPFVGAGYSWLLGNAFTFGISCSLAFQHTGDSFRASQFAGADLRMRVLDRMGAGLRFQEALIDYQFNAGSIVGHGHSLGFRPSLFVDFSL